MDIARHPLIDEILDARREHARGQDAAYEGYRNHAQRLHVFVRAIASLSADDDEKVAIAAAFHDLCAFDGLDYLEPSIEEASRYLCETGRDAWDGDVARIVAFHHRVRPYRGRRRARGAVPACGLQRRHHGRREGRHPARAAPALRRRGTGAAAAVGRGPAPR